MTETQKHQEAYGFIRDRISCGWFHAAGVLDDDKAERYRIEGFLARQWRKLVKWFGNTSWFKRLWKSKLDRIVAKLKNNGVEDTPYYDKNH